MRKAPVALWTSVACLCIGSTVRGEIITPMTPEKVKEAITFGTAAKDVRLYGLSANMGRVSCGFTTPFLRVAMAAREAKKNYKPFTDSDVTEAMTAPTVELACLSTFIGGSGPEAKRTFANVDNVVLTGKEGADPVQPVTKEPMPETYQNAFGAKVEASGLLVSFPLEAFTRPGAEVHVIYDKRVKYGFSGCEDCTIKVKIEKDVR